MTLLSVFTPSEILNYVIIRQIGFGGMGRVFLARNKNIEQYVAIKMLHPRLAGNPILRQKFKQEAVLLSSLNHPNIVRFLNYVENEYGVFLIMEFVDGMTLEDFISKKNGLIVEQRAFSMIDEILDAFSYAHGRNIVHLDIKPSNIFITRDGHIKIMDFGIAKIISESDPEANRQTMGTPEFMSPEQVLNRPLDTRSDIYSLGVLIHQMLTGRAPYDHTTLSVLEIKQHVINDSLPKMKEYYPYVSDGMQKVVDKATDKVPDKRFRSCVDMRKAIKDVLRPEKVNRKLLYTWVAVGAVALVCGLFAWDYFRTKVEYYADYTEHFGVPHGIGSLSSREMHHRAATYRMESSRRKPRRLTLVNSAGVPVKHIDNENSATRFTDVEFFYTDNGKIDYKKIYDEFGRLLFKLDYDENLKTATFKYDDEYGTPMRMLAETTNTYLDNAGGGEERSHISRHLLKYNESTGLLEELRYAGLNNEPLGDSDNIYGMAYEYDGEGRVRVLRFLGPDGKPHNNHIGLGMKNFGYDEDGNWIEVRYYAVDGSPSHDGNNVAVVEIEYDKWGNRLSEYYTSANGSPVVRTDVNCFGFRNEYDDKGNRIKQTYLGPDKLPISNNNGIATIVNEYDADGRPIRVSYLDTEGKLCSNLDNGDMFDAILIEYTDRGLISSYTPLDENGDPTVLPSGRVSSVKWEYDTAGYPVKIAYYDEKGNPAKYLGSYNYLVRDYDDLHREIRTRYYDEKGNPVENENHQLGYELDYDVSGNLSKITQIGKDGKPADIVGYAAVVCRKYDERGNHVASEFYDSKNDKATDYGGVHRIEKVYDPVTNLLVEEKYIGTKNQVGSRHYAYDANGNKTKEYMLNSTGRLNGHVDNYQYDKYNRIIRSWASKTDGSKINYPDGNFAIIACNYDERGNLTEKMFFDTAGNPALDNMATHKRVTEYDNLNRAVHELNYGKDGKPAQGRNAYSECRAEYDSRGNMTVITTYDGYGKPAIGADGFHKLTKDYDRFNRVTSMAYFGLNGEPVDSKSNGYSRVENAYDENGNHVSEKYYKANGKFDYEFRVKYNDKGQPVEYTFLDSNGKLHTGRDVARLTISYEDDGLTPVRRKYYNAYGSCLVTQQYNKKTDTWN